MIIWVLGSLGAVAALWIGGLVFLRTVWFHRDPTRTPDERGDVLISPVDGMVVYVRPFTDGNIVCDKLGEKIRVEEITSSAPLAASGWMMGIYMSPLDVHFSYSPVDAAVESVEHKQASVNLAMVDLWEYVRIVWLRKLVQLFGRRFHLENERTTLQLSSSSLQMALVLIADKFVNKISCFVKPGDSVHCGGKLAFIGRGSQCDVVIFDDSVRVVVEPGQHVYGGQTVIARLGETG